MRGEGAYVENVYARKDALLKAALDLAANFIERAEIFLQSVAAGFPSPQTRQLVTAARELRLAIVEVKEMVIG